MQYCLTLSQVAHLPYLQKMQILKLNYEKSPSSICKIKSLMKTFTHNSDEKFYIAKLQMSTIIFIIYTNVIICGRRLIAGFLRNPAKK